MLVELNYKKRRGKKGKGKKKGEEKKREKRRWERKRLIVIIIVSYVDVIQLIVLVHLTLCPFYWTFAYDFAIANYALQ